jgi:serine phosphatase RsbU (regulator of sigma subunit)/pSer/pThr/pTyr-binding forkhead associated (FHA) protein
MTPGVYNLKMATLVVVRGPKQGQQFLLGSEGAVIGRIGEVPISLPSQTVSRRHAQISLLNGAYVVKDLNSANGTFLNDRRLTTAQPLTDGDQLRFGDWVLVFQDDAEPRKVVETEPDKTTLSVVDKVDAAVSNEMLYQDQPGHKLQILLDLARHLGQTLEVQPMLDKLLQHLLDLFPLADRGLIVLCEDDRLLVRAQRSRFRGDADFRFSRSVIREALRDGAGLLSADIHADQRFSGSGTVDGLETSSLLCVPLIVHDGRRLGVIQLDCTRPDRAFERYHLHLLTTVGLLAAVVLDNVALHALRVREETLRRDLELARGVQRGLLPENYPNYEDFEFFAYYSAAYDVGGDYYDFIELPNERLAIVVADVAGKGISAALMMAKLSGELKHLLSCEPAGTALARLNESLCAGNTGRFVTLLAVVLDRRSATLTVVNAGHPAPFRRRTDGSVEAVGEPVRGTALGLFPGRAYAEVRTAIEPGEVWLAYTDGFTEAANATGELFGTGRLRERLMGTAAAVREAGDRIIDEVRAFRGSQPQGDDMCLVAWSRPAAPTEGTGEQGGPGSPVVNVLDEGTTTAKFQRPLPAPPLPS